MEEALRRACPQVGTQNKSLLQLPLLPPADGLGHRDLNGLGGAVAVVRDNVVSKHAVAYLADQVLSPAAYNDVRLALSRQCPQDERGKARRPAVHRWEQREGADMPSLRL